MRITKQEARFIRAMRRRTAAIQEFSDAEGDYLAESENPWDHNEAYAFLADSGTWTVEGSTESVSGLSRSEAERALAYAIQNDGQLPSDDDIYVSSKNAGRKMSAVPQGWKREKDEYGAVKYIKLFGGAEAQVRDTEGGPSDWIVFHNNGGYVTGEEPTLEAAFEAAEAAGFDSVFGGF